MVLNGSQVPAMLRTDFQEFPSCLSWLVENLSPWTLLQESPSVDASPVKNSIFVGVRVPSYEQVRFEVSPFRPNVDPSFSSRGLGSERSGI